MNGNDLELLRFPIGRYTPHADEPAEFQRRLRDLQHAPTLLEHAVVGLSAEHLAQPYRPGGWTLQQTVHHVADSHMNAFVRMKMALTMDQPTITPYDQDAFVNSADVMQVPVNHSITLLYALHTRLVELLENTTPSERTRAVIHPEHERPLTVWTMMGIYAWHGKHHAMQIVRWRERNGK